MKALFLFFLLKMSPVALAGGGVVDNGGGAGELAVIYAQQNFQILTEPCLHAGACGLNEREFRLLRTLASELTSKLLFVREQELPNLLYRTDPVPGAEVVINKDRLWRVSATGDLRAFTVADGVELLATALSSHLSGFSEPDKASLSGKLGAFLTVSRMVTMTNLASSNLRAVLTKGDRFDLFFVDDGFDTFVALSELMRERLPCAADSLGIFPFRWQSPLNLEPSAVHVILSGRIRWTCGSNSYFGDVSVVLKLVPVEGTVEQYWIDRRSNLRVVPGGIEVIVSGSSL